MAFRALGKRAKSEGECQDLDSPPCKISKIDGNPFSKGTAFWPIASVKALFVKPSKGGKMEAVSEIQVSASDSAGKPMEGKLKNASISSSVVSAVRSFLQTGPADSAKQMSWIQDCNCHNVTPRQLLLSCSEDAKALKIHPGSLRENIQLDFTKSKSQHGDTDLNLGFRDLMSGMLLRIGQGENSVQIRVTFPCEPCGHVIDMMKTAPIGPKVLNPLSLKALSSPVGRRGMLAVVVQGGVLKEGDAVEVLACHSDRAAPASPMICYETLADDVKGRVAWLVPRIPKGKVLPFRELLQFVGAPSGYARALPAILKGARAAKKDFPFHRVVDTHYGLLRQFLPEQRALLEEEGVETMKAKSAPSKDKGNHTKDQNLVVKNGVDRFLWKPTQQELFLKKVFDTEP